MTGLVEATDAGMQVTLPPVLAVEAAADLAEALRGVDLSAPLTIDAAGVETVNTAYVLVLISLLNSRPDDAPKIGISDPTPPLLDAFSDLGYFSELMKMEFLT